MNKQQTLSFSIIVPTYNEELEIEGTLDHLVNLNYKHKEIIVVDDSNDNTPMIVQKFLDLGVKLIHPKKREGRCEARNLGIEHAKGDVIIFLNADVLLPNDFLEKISRHYENGYDAVGVMNLVENLDSVYSRYVGMHNYRKIEKGVIEARKKNLKNIWWTEGFSARRSLVLKTSLFPTNFSVPICAGEDVRFVDELRQLGTKGIYDESIIVKHIAPSTFKEYWKIRKGRGAGTPQIRKFMDNWSYQKIALVALFRVAQSVLKSILILPMLYHNYHLAKFSEAHTAKETLLFSYAWLVERVAISYGEFESLIRIIKAEKNKTHNVN